MVNKNLRHTFLSLLTLLCFSTFLISCKEKSLEGMIVVTQLEGDVQSGDYTTGELWRYLPNARISFINPDNPKEIKVLTSDFFSACGPKISYDGSAMLFAGQKEEGDVWQIWEMKLSSNEARQVTSEKENCIDPDYLPGERVVFSKTTNYGEAVKAHAIFTGNLDGTNISQVTFDPSAYFAPTILKDGRILAIGKPVFPDSENASLKVMRPDGTKNELFYKTDSTTQLFSQPIELDNGKIVFANLNSDNSTGLMSIDYNRPLNSMVNVTNGLQGDFYAINRLQGDKLLTNYRADKKDRFALYEFDTKSKSIGEPIYKDDKHHILDAVMVQKRKRPKKLPSEVNLEIETALLMCQDINSTPLKEKEAETELNKANRFEILGINSSLGRWNAEEDGSFYIKITPDTPFRIQTIDENDNVVNTGSWLYLRPNERRGCIGCHGNNEMAPKNRQPLAVRKEPIHVISLENRLDIEKYSKE